MPVSVSSLPVLYPLPGVDRRLPIAKWYAQANATGDATGGSLSLNITLPRKGNTLYSVEDYAAEDSSGVAGYEVRIRTAEVAAEAQSLEGAIFLATQQPVAGINFVLRGEAKWKFELIFQPTTTDAALFARTTNTNLASYIFNAWGFQWDPEATKMPGGPIKPGQVALYSTNALR